MKFEISPLTQTRPSSRSRSRRAELTSTDTGTIVAVLGSTPPASVSGAREDGGTPEMGDMRD